ncbi:MAG: hypothetical protein RLZZ261_710 [Bacteroidota bacterium]|jgi:hypothetical protein
MSRFLRSSVRTAVALAFLVVSVFTSCEKSNGEVGIDFVDESALAFGDKQSVSIRSWSEEYDSLLTLRPNALVVGSYDDPVFGRPTASFATQLILASVAPNFGTNPTVDSVFMIMPYAGWYGDTSAAFRIKVHRSAVPLTDSVYYGFSALSPGLPLCDTTFRPDAIVKTLKTGVRSGKAALALRLDAAKMQQWIVDEAIARPGNFSSNAAFIDYFRGIVVSGTDQNQAMYQFNPGDAAARIRIYYTNDSIRADTSAAGKDYGLYQMAFSSGVQSFIRITYDRSSAQFDLAAQDTTLGEPTTYIQGMGGAVTVLRLDGLRALVDSGYVVNYAELVVPVREGSNLRHAVPASLSILHVNGSTKTLIRDYLRGNPGGSFSASGVLRKGAYKFVVTRHVQDLLRYGDTASFKMMLVPERMASSPARVVLHGNRDAVAPMSLNLWYTKPN